MGKCSFVALYQWDPSRVLCLKTSVCWLQFRGAVVGAIWASEPQKNACFSVCACKDALACPQCPYTNPRIFSPPPPSVLSLLFVAPLLSGSHFRAINAIFTGKVFKKSQYLKSSYLNWVFISAVKYSWEFFYRKTLRCSLKWMCAVCLSARKGKMHTRVSSLPVNVQRWELGCNCDGCDGTALLMIQMCFYGTAQADLVGNVTSIFTKIFCKIKERREN